MSSPNDSIVLNNTHYKEEKRKDEAIIRLPTEEDIKNSDTMYLYVENTHGSKQFIPFDCTNLKELTICNSKKKVIEKFNK